MPILTIHDSDFETNVCASSAPVLLDFWADWCAPCRMLAPILEEVSAAKPDLLIGKINVEEEARAGRTISDFEHSNAYPFSERTDGKTDQRSASRGCNSRNDFLICNCSEPSRFSCKSVNHACMNEHFYMEIYLADTPHRRNA